MATSLSKLKSQIQKLQKRVSSIQSTVISRIKREIAQHGLSIEDLFGTESAVAAGKGTPAPQKKATGAKKSGADKPAKFADGQGNTWHGIGKRPQWIHDVLAAGRKLEEFLVGETKDSAAAKPARKTRVKTVAKTAKPATPAKAAKKAAPAKKAPAAKKAAVKAAPKKKAPAKKAAKARAESAPASAPTETS